MSGLRVERNRVFLIKKCFAFAFILLGRAKDAVTVIRGTTLLGESVVARQHTANMWDPFLLFVRRGLLVLSKINPLILQEPAAGAAQFIQENSCPCVKLDLSSFTGGEERALSCPLLFQDVCSGSEEADGCSSPACAERSFLHPWRPDAAVGYPGGVWYSCLRYVTARPATKAPVTSLHLRGRRCTAAPNEPERTNSARTATSVAPGTILMCQPGTCGR